MPLPALAIGIITSLPRFAGSAYVFPAQRARRTSADLSPAEARATQRVSGYSKAKAQVDRLVAADGREMPAWRWHDLRRTARTNLSRLRVPDTVKELVLGHVAQGLVAVYDQWLYLDEKREALDPWANLLASILDPGAGAGKVVPLPANEK